MRNLVLLFMISGLFLVFACNKDEPSERFKLLTTPVWESDSLLANGLDASGEGESLANFKGEVKFNKDGTGNFGSYAGKWRFAQNETEIVILTDSLPLPLATRIEELTASSLKIITTSPINNDAIRMTFKAKP